MASLLYAPTSSRPLLASRQASRRPISHCYDQQDNSKPEVQGEQKTNCRIVVHRQPRGASCALTEDRETPTQPGQSPPVRRCKSHCSLDSSCLPTGRIDRVLPSRPFLRRTAGSRARYCKRPSSWRPERRRRDREDAAYRRLRHASRSYRSDGPANRMRSCNPSLACRISCNSDRNPGIAKMFSDKRVTYWDQGLRDPDRR